ncbi:MAG: hypothetical protein ACPGVU_11675 [Limisphaerales bacterium]
MAVGAGLKRAKKRFADTSAKESFGKLLTEALRDSNKQNSDHRRSAIALLGYGDYARVKDTLFALLSPEHSPRAQLAALGTLDGFTSAKIADQILAHWKSFTPSIREEALRVLLRRTTHQLALLQAIKTGSINAREIPFSRQGYLKRSRNPQIKAAATKLFGSQSVASRGEALRMFKPALQLRGNPIAGAKHVGERCHTCHRFKNKGFALAPDLETVQAWTAEELLTHILDPNRKVEPEQRAFTIETKDDESYVGLIESESEDTVTLRMPNGIRQQLMRSQIRSLTSQGLSLMPEGLEAGLTPQDLADLIAFLKN